MNFIQTRLAQAVDFLRRHRKTRIALLLLCLFLLLTVLLRPHGQKTFLVIGMDNYGSLDEIGRSDVTMLVQVDFTRAKISAVTFARDMFVENEDGRLEKINTLVRSRGEQALCDAVTRNFGVPIDGWFRVNFTTVIELVDAIGGAEVELTAAEVNYLNRNQGRFEDYPLSEGLCRLNGAQALAYARCRKLDNDLGRGSRQGKLLAAMVRQAGRMSASNIGAVFSSLKHAWRSSYSPSEQVQLLLKALWLRGASVEHIGVPFDGAWRYGEKGGVNGVVADLPENRRLLLEALGRPVPTE